MWYAGEFRRFESVRWTQLRTRWILDLEEHRRLGEILTERLLSEEKTLKLNDFRFLVSHHGKSCEEMGEALGLTPEEWDAVRNDDPTPARSDALKAYFRSLRGGG